MRYLLGDRPRALCLRRALVALAVLLIAASCVSAQKQMAVLSVDREKRGGVIRVALSPDGKQLAALVTGDPRSDEDEDHIRVWDLKTRKELVRLRGGGAGNYGQVLAFTPDSKEIVNTWGKAVHIWDVKTGKKREIALKNVAGTFSTMTPDGKTVIVADTRVMLIDLKTGKELATMNAPSKVFCMAVSPDGKWLAASQVTGQVCFWDLAKRKRVGAIGAGAKNCLIAFSPDGKKLAVEQSSNQFAVWDRASCKIEKSLDLVRGLGWGKGMSLSAKGMAFTPDGKAVVLAGIGRGVGIFLWHFDTGKVTGLHDRKVGRSHRCIALSRDGKLLVTGQKAVELWDLTKPAAVPKK